MDVDADKKPIMVKNTEKATSVFFYCDRFPAGIYIHLGNGYKSCTFVAVSEADVDASEKLITVKKVTEKATLCSSLASETATERYSTVTYLLTQHIHHS